VAEISVRVLTLNDPVIELAAVPSPVTAHVGVKPGEKNFALFAESEHLGVGVVGSATAL